jgi:hypothetical protein
MELDVIPPGFVVPGIFVRILQDVLPEIPHPSLIIFGLSDIKPLHLEVESFQIRLVGISGDLVNTVTNIVHEAAQAEFREITVENPVYKPAFISEVGMGGHGKDLLSGNCFV